MASVGFGVGMKEEINEDARGAPRFYSHDGAFIGGLLVFSVTENRGGQRSYCPKRNNSETIALTNGTEQGRPDARDPLTFTPQILELRKT